MKDEKWEKPNFKGLTLLGHWRECDAMKTAQDRGTRVVVEADFCREVGQTPETIEEYLAAHFTEHDIHALMEGKEDFAEHTLSIVREHIEPRVYFQVRLFSPNDGDWYRVLDVQ